MLITARQQFKEKLRKWNPPEFIMKHVDTTDDDVNSLLAAEFGAMSLKERESIFQEIHGVDRSIEETEEFLQQKLDEMEEELDKIVIEASMVELFAYHKAIQQERENGTNYVTGRKLRLMFLRSKLFNARLAAVSFVRFLDQKLTMCGEEILSRRIRMSDLDKETVDALRSGFIQILPERDAAGRAVVVIFQQNLPCSCSARSKQLAQAYVLMTAAEDEETQRRGAVLIMYSIGKIEGKFDPHLVKENTRCHSFFPLRFVALHHCHNHPILNVACPIGMMIMGEYFRQRYRKHIGNRQHCHYELMTYGIPSEKIPVSFHGEVRTTNHLKWIAKRQARELAMKTDDDTSLVGRRRSGSCSADSTSTNKSVNSNHTDDDCNDFAGIQLPGINDVLLRRGSVFHNHPGNLRMRILVNFYQEAYSKATRKNNGKMNVADIVVQNIKNPELNKNADVPTNNSMQGRGRFLEYSNEKGYWFEVSDEEARKRVRKCFRSARSTRAKQRQQKKLMEAQIEENQGKRFKFDDGDDEDFNLDFDFDETR